MICSLEEHRLMKSAGENFNARLFAFACLISSSFANCLTPCLPTLTVVWGFRASYMGEGLPILRKMRKMLCARLSSCLAPDHIIEDAKPKTCKMFATFAQHLGSCVGCKSQAFALPVMHMCTCAVMTSQWCEMSVDECVTQSLRKFCRIQKMRSNRLGQVSTY